MQRDDDQQLWDLLGRAEPPGKLTPFFARNVSRMVRAQSSRRDSAPTWFGWRRLVPAGAVAAIALAAAWTIDSRRPVPEGEPVPDAIAQLDEIDFEVVADLDDLLALEEDKLWSDGEVSSL